ncbi:rRNA methyltransferase 3, mitochondrial [Galleria mellonella]|uniref:rRNA methyltransferase 3, mitochondrial n=1 Tax=Galleria mellonella TaxID=7137 RepID=A0A6J1WR17_GALME|nr:rRNA methyltransferase 3, mitochondrial [Galleria mellonella]
MSKNISRLLTQTLISSQLLTDSSFRFYGRWMHRDPAKVMLPFEPKSKVNLKTEKVINLDPEILNKSKETSVDSIDENKKPEKESKIFNIEKSQEIKSKREDKLKKRAFYLSQTKVFDDNNQIIFEKAKENDGRISNLLVKLKSKKGRNQSGQILVEGWRMIVDGLEAKCNLKYVIFSRTEDLYNLRPFLPSKGVKLYKIPYKQIALWSDVETSPGIFGVFDIPSPDNVRSFSRPLPLQFICDNIRVPGNLGAIFRVAVGAGCEKVVLTKGCVDIWDPKVIRSAAGAHFRLPIYNSVEWTDIPKHLNQDTTVFIADSNEKVLDENSMGNTDESCEGMHIPVLPYYGIEYTSFKHITLIIGGETEGISNDSYAFAATKNGLRVNIPLQRGVDSLNTGMAAAVIAFEIRRQLIQAWTREKLERIGLNAT